MEPKVDKNGFPYYDAVPPGWRIASMDDFHTNGRRKIGMTYIIQWVDQVKYELCTVTDRLTGAYLKQFVDQQRVYVKEETK